MSSWPRITDLFVTDGPANVALIGAPMNLGAVTPGHYDLAPQAIRETLRRFSKYDVETGAEIFRPVRTLGDINVAALSIEDAFVPVRDAIRKATAQHDLTIVLGGHNGITRPAAHGLGMPLDKVGLLTLDAHFDLRDTAGGLLNGNPVRALLDDGLPGQNLFQIGLAPFANTWMMHDLTDLIGSGVYTIADCKREGIRPILERALDRLGHVDAIIVDFDIDVIDRSQCPGAPGSRPGGMSADMFFEATRVLAAHHKVRLVDLTEFDPSLDVGEVTALTAGRWVCEILAGYSTRVSI